MANYRVYTLKLYQSKHNDEFFMPRFEVAMFLWNASVSIVRKEYKKTGTIISKYELQRRLTKIRQGTKEEFIRQLPVCASDAVTDELYSRIADYKTKKKQGLKCSFPNYKRVCNCYTLKLKGYQLKDKTLILGWHNKFKYHDSYNPSVETKIIKQIKIKKDNLGDYWIHCYVEEDMENTKERIADGEIGIDIGFDTFLTFSDGRKIYWPNFVNNHFNKLAQLRVAFSMASKCEEKEKELYNHLRRVHRNFIYKRNNFYWEIAHEICKTNQYIMVEDLDYKELCITHGRKTKALAFSNFMKILNECALKYGSKIIKVDRYFPSSKLCSKCGSIKKDLTLKDRTYICPNCEHVIDRDYQAAINIYNEGKRILINDNSAE